MTISAETEPAQVMPPSRITQEKIDDVAPANVRSRPAEMVNQDGVGTSFFQGVGEDAAAFSVKLAVGEGAVFVYRFRQAMDEAVVPPLNGEARDGRGTNGLPKMSRIKRLCLRFSSPSLASLSLPAACRLPSGSPGVNRGFPGGIVYLATRRMSGRRRGPVPTRTHVSIGAATNRQLGGGKLLLGGLAVCAAFSDLHSVPAPVGWQQAP